jgi:hypothetical protein
LSVDSKELRHRTHYLLTGGPAVRDLRQRSCTPLTKKQTVFQRIRSLHREVQRGWWGGLAFRYLFQRTTDQESILPNVQITNRRLNCFRISRKQVVQKALTLRLLTLGIRPVFGKLDRSITDFVPGKRHWWRLILVKKLNGQSDSKLGNLYRELLEKSLLEENHRSQHLKFDSFSKPSKLHVRGIKSQAKTWHSHDHQSLNIFPEGDVAHFLSHALRRQNCNPSRNWRKSHPI